MDLTQIDLHDAILRDMAIDYAARSITIRVDFYEKQNDGDRIPGSILFTDVDSLSQIVDCKELAEHTFAGHISYWRPSDVGGTTYIYLATGCVAITAKKVQLKS